MDQYPVEDEDAEPGSLHAREEPSGLLGKPRRRHKGYFKTFNGWWQAFSDQTGRRPSSQDVKAWYLQNADTAFEGERPSLRELKMHARRKRPEQEAQIYQANYRHMRRAGKVGAGVIGSSHDGPGQLLAAPGTTHRIQFLQQQQPNPGVHAGTAAAYATSGVSLQTLEALASAGLVQQQAGPRAVQVRVQQQPQAQQPLTVNVSGNSSIIQQRGGATVVQLPLSALAGLTSSLGGRITIGSEAVQIAYAADEADAVANGRHGVYGTEVLQTAAHQQTPANILQSQGNVVTVLDGSYAGQRGAALQVLGAAQSRESAESQQRQQQAMVIQIPQSLLLQGGGGGDRGGPTAAGAVGQLVVTEDGQQAVILQQRQRQPQTQTQAPQLLQQRQPQTQTQTQAPQLLQQRQPQVIQLGQQPGQQPHQQHQLRVLGQQRRRISHEEDHSGGAAPGGGGGGGDAVQPSERPRKLMRLNQPQMQLPSQRQARTQQGAPAGASDAQPPLPALAPEASVHGGDDPAVAVAAGGSSDADLGEVKQQQQQHVSEAARTAECGEVAAAADGGMGTGNGAAAGAAADNAANEVGTITISVKAEVDASYGNQEPAGAETVISMGPSYFDDDAGATATAPTAAAASEPAAAPKEYAAVHHHASVHGDGDGSAGAFEDSKSVELLEDLLPWPGGSVATLPTPLQGAAVLAALQQKERQGGISDADAEAIWRWLHGVSERQLQKAQLRRQQQQQLPQAAGNVQVQPDPRQEGQGGQRQLLQQRLAQLQEQQQQRPPSQQQSPQLPQRLLQQSPQLPQRLLQPLQQPLPKPLPRQPTAPQQQRVLVQALASDETPGEVIELLLPQGTLDRLDSTQLSQRLAQAQAQSQAAAQEVQQAHGLQLQPQQQLPTPTTANGHTQGLMGILRQQQQQSNYQQQQLQQVRMVSVQGAAGVGGGLGTTASSGALYAKQTGGGDGGGGGSGGGGGGAVLQLAPGTDTAAALQLHMQGGGHHHLGAQQQQRVAQQIIAVCGAGGSTQQATTQVRQQVASGSSGGVGASQMSVLQRPKQNPTLLGPSSSLASSSSPKPGSEVQAVWRKQPWQDAQQPQVLVRGADGMLRLQQKEQQPQPQAQQQQQPQQLLRALGNTTTQLTLGSSSSLSSLSQAVDLSAAASATRGSMRAIPLGRSIVLSDVSAGGGNRAQHHQQQILQLPAGTLLQQDQLQQQVFASVGQSGLLRVMNAAAGSIASGSSVSEGADGTTVQYVLRTG